MFSIIRFKRFKLKSLRRLLQNKFTVNVTIFLLTIFYISWHLSNELEEFQIDDENDSFQVKTIPDDDLILRVEEYKKKLEECSDPKDESWDEFYGYLNSPKKCHNKIVVGEDSTTGKGKYSRGKAICLDRQLVIKSAECVVLSFGISNNTWTFDHQMQSKGCRVFTFDPTALRKEKIRGTNILTYPIGLADSKRKSNYLDMNLRFLNFAAILKISKLEGAIIDYMMIDTDLDLMEYYALRNIVDNNPELLRYVKQIAVRINPGFISARRTGYYYIFLKLECLGFKLISSEKSSVEANLFPFKERMESTVYEVVWVNKDFQKK